MGFSTLHIVANLLVLSGTAAPAPAAALAPAPASLVVAQAQVGAASPAKATDALRTEVASIEKRRAALTAKKRALRTRYDSQLAELARLGRQRASFNRDRKIRSQKRSSQSTARQLAKIERQIRATNRPLRLARTRLLGAVRAELRATPTGARARMLRGLGRKLERSVRKRARKIVMPDGTIDPTADPEDLDEQAKLLARAEKRLADEERKLARRATQYARVDKLSQQRARAAELGRFDDNQVRRTTGFKNNRGNELSGAQGDADNSPEDGAAPPADPGQGGGADLGSFEGGDAGALEASAVVLADVVDDMTISDLRRASRSGSAKARAAAAKKARAQVKRRLELLRKQRRAVQQRANKLRNR